MVLATEVQHLVGVDVMHVRPPLSQSVSEFFRIMDRQFTRAEWQDIGSPATEDERLVCLC